MYNDNNIPSLLNNFLVHLYTTDKSENTIVNYRSDLVEFFKIVSMMKTNKTEYKDIDISNIDLKYIKTITYSNISAYLKYLKDENNNSASSRCRKITSLKEFYKFLQIKEKVISERENPSIEIDAPKIHSKERVYLNLEESRLLLNAIHLKNKSYSYKRDLFIIRTLLTCGLRRSEFAKLKVSDIQNGMIKVFEGKGKKDRTIPLNNSCILALNEWLESRKQFKINEGSEDSLLIGKKGGAMSGEAINDVVKKYVDLAGLSDEISCHNLRHSSATFLLEGGATIRDVQEFLGHENISTTQIYTHINKNRLQNAVNNSVINDL